MPWNLSELTYANKSADLSGEVGVPYGLFFGDSGTKMYTCDNSETIFQYTLSTAWDVSTASYAEKSFSDSARTGATGNIFFKTDGRVMYILDLTNDYIYQYTLSTAWDVSTASYSKSKSLGAGVYYGIYLKSDGTILYYTDFNADTVIQRNLSTAWDISTAGASVATLDTTTKTTVVGALFLKSDGTQLYYSSGAGNKIYSATMSTAWDLSTASDDLPNLDTSANTGTQRGIFFSDDGNKFFVLDSGSDTVFQYNAPITFIPQITFI